MQIIKRNGEVVEFDKTKIEEAIAKNNLQGEVFFPGYIAEEDKIIIFRVFKC